MTEEYGNKHRAERGVVMLRLNSKDLGEEFDDGTYLEAASAIADILHWVAQRNESVDRCLALAREHFVCELAEDPNESPARRLEYGVCE